MKKLLLAALFISSVTFAQKETDKWYFGLFAAMDFATGTPTVIAPGNSSYQPSEGCSVMSDASGNLLFYTDGMVVYDKTHSVMANGSGLFGGLSSTQPALIVPMGANGIYYIFTTDDYGGTDGFRYSVVDMNLAAGNGSVTVKNSLLLSSVTEKITAVKDPFSNRYWVVTHEWNTDAFYAYSLSPSGLSSPVISNVGTLHGGIMQNTYGQIKFNPCGNKLALCVGYMNIWEYFDFNTNTGKVTNPMTFIQSDKVFGIEFSPDASKIYVSTYDPQQTLVQYDLTSNNNATIATTQSSLSTTTDIYGLQLANDGKIYVCKSFSQWLGVVNSPNTLGAGCNYVDMGVDLDPAFNGYMSSLSLPGFVQSYFLPVGFSCPVPTGVDEISVKEIPLVVYPNPSASDFSIIIEKPATVQVYSFTGKLVDEINIENRKTLQFGENYAAGIYFVKVITGDKISSTKVIKK